MPQNALVCFKMHFFFNRFAAILTLILIVLILINISVCLFQCLSETGFS